MAALVWITLGVAIWHFTVFVPDRFKGGIAGAFLAAVIGAVISGALIQAGMGRSLGETDILTFLAAIPGCLAVLAITWLAGAREEPGYVGHYGEE